MVASAVGYSLGVPTLAASAGTTFTNAATLYIAGAPAAGTNVTLTNAYGIWVAGGGIALGATTPGVIGGSSGAITFTASGTNQNITLAPSGTGFALVQGSATNPGYQIRADGSSTNGGGIVFSNTLAGAGRRNWWIAGERFNAGDLVIGPSTAAGGVTFTTPTFVLTASNQVLIGGLTTAGTGVLQFPAATTSAGGINFGAEIFFFRTGTNTAQISASAGLTLTGALSTSAPASGAGAWELGTNITSGTSVFDATGYVEIEIGGALVKLGRVTNA